MQKRPRSINLCRAVTKVQVVRTLCTHIRAGSVFRKQLSKNVYASRAFVFFKYTIVHVVCLYTFVFFTVVFLKIGGTITKPQREAQKYICRAECVFSNRCLQQFSKDAHKFDHKTADLLVRGRRGKTLQMRIATGDTL